MEAIFFSNELFRSRWHFNETCEREITRNTNLVNIIQQLRRDIKSRTMLSLSFSLLSLSVRLCLSLYLSVRLCEHVCDISKSLGYQNVLNIYIFSCITSPNEFCFYKKYILFELLIFLFSRRCKQNRNKIN